jgi:hypothetical protein
MDRGGIGMVERIEFNLCDQLGGPLRPQYLNDAGATTRVRRYQKAIEALSDGQQSLCKRLIGFNLGDLATVTAEQVSA